MSDDAPRTSRLLKATSVLNLLFNLITPAVLIGVIVLLARVNSTLGKIHDKMANGVQTVEISQAGYGSKPVDVQIVDSQGSIMGTSSLNAVYVRGTS